MIARKSYSIKYKLSVLSYAEQVSSSEACRLFHINPSMLCRWRQLKSRLLTTDNRRRHLPGAGRPVSFPAEEIELSTWIKETRACGYPVTYSDLKDKMSHLVHDISFKGSNGWLYGFLRRFQFSLRHVTHRVSNTCSSDRIDSSNNVAKLKAFHSFLEMQQSLHHFGKIVNVDQTPVWLDIGSTGKTVDQRGKVNISAIIPPGNSREKLTVILAADETGRKLPPAIIVKSSRKLSRISLMNGVLVFHNPKTSMANSDIMSKWIKIMLPYSDYKSLLILDSFRGHLAEQVKCTCDENNIIRAVIPGGLTSKCQPIDLTVNRSFKCHLKRYYRHYGLKERKDQAGKMTIQTFNLTVFTRAVRYAWDGIKSEAVVNGFRAMHSSAFG